MRGLRHLLALLAEYEDHYNRPHRGIYLEAPERIGTDRMVGNLDEVRRAGVLGGLISEYEGVAA